MAYSAFIIMMVTTETKIRLMTNENREKSRPLYSYLKMSNFTQKVNIIKIITKSERTGQQTLFEFLLFKKNRTYCHVVIFCFIYCLPITLYVTTLNGVAGGTKVELRITVRFIEK
jgi:hypothetical protein